MDVPCFDLGMSPCGGLYSSVDDLAKLAIALLKYVLRLRCVTLVCSDGRAANGQLIHPRTLKQMYTPQEGGDFGLGFSVSDLLGSSLHPVCSESPQERKLWAMREPCTATAATSGLSLHLALVSPRLRC